MFKGSSVILFWNMVDCFPVCKGQTEMGQGVPGLQDSSHGYHRPTGEEAGRAAEGAMGKPSILDKKDKHGVCNSLFPKLLFYLSYTSWLYKNTERIGWNFSTQTCLGVFFDGKHKFNGTTVFCECVLLSPRFILKDMLQIFKNSTCLISFSILNDLIFQFKMPFCFEMFFYSVSKNTQLKWAK